MPTVDEVPLEQFGRILLEVEADLREADYEPTLEDFIPVLEAGEATAFQSGTEPGGAAWVPLAESTIRKKGHGIILVETEKLMKSLTSGGGDAVRETTERGMIFGTSVEYSSFLEDGTSRMPARPHVGMSEGTLEQLVNAIADATVQALIR